MNLVTREDVIQELKKYSDNVTARSWLKNDKMLDHIVEVHNSWNSDHQKLGKLDMVYPLDFHMETFLDEPWKMEILLKNKQ